MLILMNGGRERRSASLQRMIDHHTCTTCADPEVGDMAGQGSGPSLRKSQVVLVSLGVSHWTPLPHGKKLDLSQNI